MAKFRLFLACTLVLLLAPLAANAQPSTADIQQRDELIHAQEALLNAYRCRFDIDVQIVPGGCVNGAPGSALPSPGPFAGTPTDREIEIRDHLIATQEALLNAYRCRFSIDVHIVPGGCDDSGAPAWETIGQWAFLTSESGGLFVAVGDALRISALGRDAGTIEPVGTVTLIVRCSVGSTIPVFVWMGDVGLGNSQATEVSATWRHPSRGEPRVDEVWAVTRDGEGHQASLVSSPDFRESLKSETDLLVLAAQPGSAHDLDSEWVVMTFAVEGAHVVMERAAACRTPA